jgi:vancomycin resistance protein YoaR
MNVSHRLGSAAAGMRGVALPLPAPSRALARHLTAACAALTLFVLAGAAGLGLYAGSHAGRIYEGIHVAGVDLGGLTPDEARAELDRAFTAYAASPLTLTAANRDFQLTPAEAGAHLDSAATVAVAMDWGRVGSAWEQSRAWARGLIDGVSIDPVIDFAPGAAHDSIAAIAPDVVRPAVNATLAFDPSGAPKIVPDLTGIRLDYAATESALAERIARFSSEPVPLITHDDPAGITAASLAPSLPEAKAAVDAPLTLAADDAVWHVPAASLQPLISVDPATSALRIDRRPLTTLVQGLAPDIDHDAVDAGITVDDNGRLAVVPSVPAAKVDVEASVSAIVAGLTTGKNAVDLVVHDTPAKISDAMAAAAVSRGEKMMQPGIAMTWQGGKGTLDRGDLLKALTIHTKPGAKDPFVFGLDPDIVHDELGAYAADFDIPVQDARWRLAGGQIQLAVPESKGRELDLDRGVTDVQAAFGSEKPAVTLQVRTLNPTWTAKDAAKITLGGDVLGEGGTYYGDSSDARRNNIEVASSYLSGWLVPPDGIFSYADSIGLITEQNGFVTGLGIVDNGNGGFTTAPVVGGGICQVSTTLFQAVFWAGLPIVERHQHPYYIRSYGEAVTGLPGLDAMVNIEPDWRVDMRFKNATGHWMAVVLIPDGNMLYARLIGTNPGWKVVVPDPVISNEVPADDQMYYTDSPELPQGTERIVESAQEGFDVSIDRQVYDKSGKLILEDDTVSSFSPSRNTTLRGTGTDG